MKERKNVLIFIAIGIVVVGAIIYYSSATDMQESAEQQSNKQQAEITMDTKLQTLPDGLQIADLAVGTGNEAMSGKMVTVHYTGTLTDGVKFDSSLDRGTPFTFTLGVGQVIRGWDEGVMGMKVGGKRKLVIPPDLGYGSQGIGGVIPPNATLIFEVELLDVK